MRIAAAPSVADYFLPTLIAEYLSRHSEVQIELLVGAAPVDLISRRVDVALRVGSAANHDRNLVIRRLVRSCPVIVAAPAYLEMHGTPTTVKALNDHRAIGLTRARRWVFEDETQSPAIEPRLLVPSASLARKTCLEGAGLALLPLFLVEADLERGRLIEVRVSRRAAAKNVHVVYAPADRKNPKVRTFVDSLLQSVSPKAPGAGRRP